MDAFDFGVDAAGAIAHARLRHDGDGDLAAVFKSSFYLRLGRDFVCIGTSAIGMGPLNAASSAPAGTDWLASGLRRGERVRLRQGVVRIGHRFRFDASGAACWRPPAMPAGWTAASLAAGLAHLDGCLDKMAPEEGLARLLSAAPGPVTAERELAATPHARLQAWLGQVMRGEDADGGLDGVEPLLGLGPGLTPAGDDLIAGVLVVLNMLGDARAVGQLKAMLARFADDRTGPLSAAHLNAAAEGMAAEAVHATLAGLLAGDVSGLRENLARLTRIGHSSGWDALAGMVSALNAWAEANPPA